MLPRPSPRPRRRDRRPLPRRADAAGTSAATGTTSSRCPAAGSARSSATSRATTRTRRPSWASCGSCCARTPPRGTPRPPCMARASVFLHELDTDRFATCTYAEADLSTGVRPGGPGRAHRPAGAHPTGPAAGPRGGRAAARPVRRVRPPGVPGDHRRTGPRANALLCTDGLVEQPGADLDDGIQAPAHQCATGPADRRAAGRPLCGPSDDGAATTWPCSCCAAAPMPAAARRPRSSSTWHRATRRPWRRPGT